MTAPTTERPVDAPAVEPEPLTPWPADDARPSEATSAAPDVPIAGAEDEGPADVPLRPLVAAALSTIAAATVAGGIFGSWYARGLGLFAAVFGVFWAWLTLRSRQKETTYQALLVPVALVIGIVLVLP